MFCERGAFELPYRSEVTITIHEILSNSEMLCLLPERVDYINDLLFYISIQFFKKYVYIMLENVKGEFESFGDLLHIHETGT